MMQLYWFNIFLLPLFIHRIPYSVLHNTESEIINSSFGFLHHLSLRNHERFPLYLFTAHIFTHPTPRSGILPPMDHALFDYPSTSI